MSHNHEHLLINGIDYTNTTWEYVHNWCEHTSLITSLLTILIFTPIFLIYAPKKASEKFKKLYPDEDVLFASKNYLLFVAILLYCLGGLFGKYILPFFFFKNTFSFGNIHMYEWLIYIFFWLLVTWGVGLRLTITYVFSNKRIELVSAFDMYDWIFKKDSRRFKNSIEYKDISQVEADVFALVVTRKNTKEKFQILFQAELKKMEKIIKQNLAQGGNNE